MRKYLAFSAATALTVLAAAGQAMAAQAGPQAPVLSAPVSSASCNSNNPSNTVTTGSVCNLQGAQALVVQAPFVALQATINDAPGVATQDASADLSYQFAVVGGTFGQQVTVNIFTNLITMADPGDVATAIMDYGSGQGVRACTGGDNCTQSGFHDSVSYLVTIGSVQTIAFHVLAEEGFFTGGYVFASADPLITVAAADNPDGQLRIILSDGVGNGLPPTGGVPEPGARALMLMGFGGLGAMLRRRGATASA